MVHEKGAMARTPWDFMPMHDQPGARRELNTFLSKMYRLWSGFSPPFVPKIDQAGTEALYFALKSESAQSFLKKLDAEWRKG